MLSMSLLAGQCLQDVHLIYQKINLIITEEGIVLKIVEKLKEDAVKIINYEEKEMILLNDEKNNYYEEQEACNICEGNFCTDEDD